MSSSSPAGQRITVSAGTAFKIGFFGALGAAVLPIALTAIAALIALIFGFSLLGLAGLRS